MSLLLSENWGDFLLPILRNVFDKQMEKHKDYIHVIYNVENSKKAQEFTHGIGSIGLMQEWDASGRQIHKDQINKGYKATYTHKKYSNSIDVERELMEDAQYSEVKKLSRKLADSLYFTRQYHAVLPFNNVTSFLGPDGKALAATDHPLGPNNSNTWSNYATGRALTPDNVERVRNDMMEWKDDRGNLVMVNPDTLIVPRKQRKAALVVADTDKEPSTADNDVNIWKGAVDVIEWHFLTDADMWFMVDMNRMKQFLTWYQRRKGVIEKDKENFDSEVQSYKVVERFSYGFDESSFLYACKSV